MPVQSRHTGLLTNDSNNEIYHVWDVQITQKELILTVMAPTVLQLIS